MLCSPLPNLINSARHLTSSYNQYIRHQSRITVTRHSPRHSPLVRVPPAPYGAAGSDILSYLLYEKNRSFKWAAQQDPLTLPDLYNHCRKSFNFEFTFISHSNAPVKRVYRKRCDFFYHISYCLSISEANPWSQTFYSTQSSSHEVKWEQTTSLFVITSLGHAKKCAGSLSYIFLQEIEKVHKYPPQSISARLGKIGHSIWIPEKPYVKTTLISHFEFFRNSKRVWESTCM